MSSASVDVSHYTYRVSWSPEDEEFVATCVELPSLSWLADSPGAALSGMYTLVAEAVDDLSASGESLPS